MTQGTCAKTVYVSPKTHKGGNKEQSVIWDINQDWLFQNVHWTLFWNVADFKSDPYSLSITHHMWQVEEVGSALYVRFAHGFGQNLETEPGWLAKGNIWAGS